MLKRLAMIFGAIFILVGLLGFVSNPLVGPDGFFMTNGAHNIAHLLIGAVLVFASTQTERAAWISTRPSGAATMVVLPLSSTTTSNRAAACRAAATRSRPGACPVSRSNSRSCGVSTSGVSGSRWSTS